MEVILSKKAVKALTAINDPTKTRIVDGIYGLPNGDIKKLKGYTVAFRLRIGDYRVIFEMLAAVK